MKFWEAMRYLEEGYKVRKKTWCEGEYILIDEEGRIIDEGDYTHEITKCNEDWEIYDDRKEVKNEKLKRICNEITKYISEDDYSEQNRELKMLKDYLYDFSCMIERVNKEYKLDK